MKKIYKYISLLIINILTISLFTMCSDNSRLEEKESQEKVINNRMYRIEDSVEGVNKTIDDNLENNNQKRDYRTNLIGNNEDIITLMIYMCGSDLESIYGTATTDINEILSAEISNNLNIIIETGGCNSWAKEEISDDKNQIFKVENGQLVLIKDDLGVKNMAEANTLTDFISYSKENYPANRYGLIIWNHGLGTLEGFGKDEKFSNDTMKLYSLDDALKESNTYFDFIGFDACFMSTVEVAYTLEDYADYLIASAEIEPFAGWYYTNWLSQLSNNTSMSTIDLAKIIIDDFVVYNSYGEVPEKAILTVTDLTDIDYVYNELCNLLDEIDEELLNENYDNIALIRSETKAFAENLIDHVDLLDLAENINLQSSQNVINSINQCVKYSGKTITMDEVGGLSIYFPYYKINYFNKYSEAFYNLDFKEEHFKFITDFINSISEGRINIIGKARSFDEDKEAEINRYDG